MNEKALPASIDAERFIIGSVLLRGVDCFAALPLSREDFAIEKHRRLWQRIVGLAERGESIDRVTLANELIRFGELESVDGLGYLASLDEGMPVIENLEAYVRIIREKAALRRL